MQTRETVPKGGQVERTAYTGCRRCSPRSAPKYTVLYTLLHLIFVTTYQEARSPSHLPEKEVKWEPISSRVRGSMRSRVKGQLNSSLLF